MSNDVVGVSKNYPGVEDSLVGTKVGLALKADANAIVFNGDLGGYSGMTSKSISMDADFSKTTQATVTYSADNTFKITTSTGTIYMIA